MSADHQTLIAEALHRYHLGYPVERPCDRCLVQARNLWDSPEFAAVLADVRAAVAREIDAAASLHDRSSEWRDGMDEAADIARERTSHE